MPTKFCQAHSNAYKPPKTATPTLLNNFYFIIFFHIFYHYCKQTLNFSFKLRVELRVSVSWVYCLCQI